MLNTVNAGQDAQHPYKFVIEEAVEGDDYLLWMYKVTSVKPTSDASMFNSKGRNKPHVVYWTRPGFAENKNANLTLATVAARDSSDLSGVARTIEATTNPVYGTLMINVGKETDAKGCGDRYFLAGDRKVKKCKHVFTSDAVFDKLVRKTSQAGYVFRFDTAFVDIYSPEAIATLGDWFPLELEFDFTKSNDRAAVAQQASVPMLSNCQDYPRGWTDVEGDGCANYAADNG